MVEYKEDDTLLRLRRRLRMARMYVRDETSADIVRDAFLAAELGESETFIAALVIADRIRTWLLEQRIDSFDSNSREVKLMRTSASPPGGSLRLALKQLVQQGWIEPLKGREGWYDVIYRSHSREMS